MTNPAITVENVSKHFPRKRGIKEYLFSFGANPTQASNFTTALHNVNLEIYTGEIFGLLGPNGSGKTTLQKIICGLLLPNTGTVKVLGKDVLGSNCAALQRTSYVFDGERSFYWRLTGQQNLEFFAALSGCNITSVRERIPVYARMLDMEEHINKMFANFSAGNKQKLSLIRSLLTNPTVLVMDEPTRSLDPEAAYQVCSLIKNLVQQKQTTVIWATHNLSEAEDICQRIAIVRQGRIVSETSAPGIKETYFRVMHPSGQVGSF